ncbi:MAG: ABC transporter ATP-binding protein [Candidatus Delongbacteria bacterium]
MARQLAVRFPDGTCALEGLDLELQAGEFVSLVGPSGCGKSTLLRVAAGLQAASSGSLEVPDAGLAFVFQFPTLLPWCTIAENVALPRRLGHGGPRPAEDLLRLVGLAGFADHYPRQLSGGMQMRASLARALATQPRLLLQDEPFAALDEITRQRLNEDLLVLWERERWTSLFVTHNVLEAVFLSQRVHVLSARPGRVAATFEIPFPYPRAAGLRAQPEFARLGGAISQALREASA